MNQTKWTPLRVKENIDLQGQKMTERNLTLQVMTEGEKRGMMTKRKGENQNRWKDTYQEKESQETEIGIQETQERVIDQAARAHIETGARRITDQAQDQGHQVTEVTIHQETQATTDPQKDRGQEAKITKDLRVMTTNRKTKGKILIKVIQKKTSKNMMIRKSLIFLRTRREISEDLQSIMSTIINAHLKTATPCTHRIISVKKLIRKTNKFFSSTRT